LQDVDPSIGSSGLLGKPSGRASVERRASASVEGRTNAERRTAESEQDGNTAVNVRAGPFDKSGPRGRRLDSQCEGVEHIRNRDF
jgi:hypothetical protein